MSDSFFNQSMSPPQPTASLKPRKTRAAPPPPPPARSNATNNTSAAAAPSYYGNSASTQQQARSTAPPPPRRPAAAQTTTTASTSHSSGTAAPSFYGNNPTTSSTTNNRAAGNYSASNTSGTSYYGTPAPAAAYSNSASTSAFANTTISAAPANTNNEWNGAANNTTTTSTDWYSRPQQQQQQSQYASQPSAQQPAYTDFTQQQQQQPFPMSTPSLNTTELAGSIGSTTALPAVPPPEQGLFSTFVPQPATMQSTSNLDEYDFEDEAPLLEELGVNLQHILTKTKAVVLPFSKFGMQAQQVLHEDDNDLAGPLVFCVLLGGELLLSGKLQFSYIYGFCTLGCILLTLVLNLMSPLPVSIWTVASILGYALLPVNILAIFKILLVDLIRLPKVEYVLALVTIVWCTVASTRLLEQKCDMRAQRYLLAYPIALLYSAFVMITIF